MHALHNLYPGNIADEPDTALQAILRAVVVRTNFVPAVRYRLGWRGLKNCSVDAEAWTARIADLRLSPVRQIKLASYLQKAFL